MLTTSHLTTILPVVEIERARSFYEHQLGLAPAGARADGSFEMRTGDGSTIALVPRPDRKPAENTAASFEVPDIRAEIQDLERHGVRFEDYDLPGLKTVDHVFAGDDMLCAWFTDTEGNILCLHQPAAAPQ